MAERPSDSDHLLLSIEILRRIPRHRKTSVAELHAELTHGGIVRERRTIERQLEKLRRQFPDLERDESSRPNGYRWKENAAPLFLPHLSPQDSLMFCLAREHLRSLLPARLMRGMDTFFDQAERNLGLGQGNATLAREWREKVRVVATSQPLIPPRIAPDIFEAVTEALYHNRWLNLDYRNAQGQARNSDVMPLGLAQQGPRMYLVCRFRGYDDERSLALHRIQSARVSTLGFERPANFDLGQYDADGRFGYGDGRKIRLGFRITRAAGLHLTESPLSEDQTVTEGEGFYDITATVVESDMLDWWLRGFGDAVSQIRREPILLK